ncbi:MAG: InlB B-repeat-containing protein [Limisphaerales bacterium]
MRRGVGLYLSTLVFLTAAISLRAESPSYAGVYLGQTTDNLGGFALFVDGNQQAVLIGGYRFNDDNGDAVYGSCTVDAGGNGNSDISGITTSFTISSNGSVSLNANADDSSYSYQMEGSLVSSGPFLSVSGLYSANISGGQTVMAIVAPDGWIYGSSPNHGGGGRVRVTAYGKPATESSLGHKVGTFTLNQNATLNLSGTYTLKRVDAVGPATNSAILTVNPPNSGTIAGIKNGQVLKIGASYPVSAVASKGHLFSNWTDGGGNVLSSAAKFVYNDTDGKLTANFVSNPFYNTPLAGTYVGLYFDTTNGSFVVNSGYITIAVSATGSLSGKLYNADYSKTVPSLSGQLTLAGNGSMATATLPAVQFGKHYAQVTLQVATDTNLNDAGAGTLTGFVNFYSNLELTNPIYSSAIDGKLAFYTGHTPLGNYNFAIAPLSADPAQGPGGYSLGTATISKKGAVALALTLADGASPPISFATALAKDGTCPVYAALYGGEGMIMGWLQFNTTVSGTLDWFTASEFKSSIYPNGFSGRPSLNGDLYVAPKAGTNIMGWTSGGVFETDAGYSGLSLPDETNIPLTFNPAKNTFADTGNVSINFKSSNGALSGTLPDGPPKNNFSGVVFKGTGYGFYEDANGETGPIVISPP